MDVRGSLARAALLVGAFGGCAAYTGEEGGPEEAPAEDQPLDITVDSVEVVHGALRVSATMVDGAADVSVRLGGDCEHREVGGGLSTLSTLVWALGAKDVAEAIGCGLVVRARVRDGVRYVSKVAELGVSVDVAAQDPEGAEDGPQLQSVTTSEAGVDVVFAGVSPGARLSTGDSLLGAATAASGEDAAPGDEAGRFSVPCIDFARSVLGGRALHLDGSSFPTSLSVGGTSLQAEPQGADEPQDEEDEGVEEEAPAPHRAP